MTSEKIAKLISTLTSKTLNKKAIWTKGSGSNQFLLSIGNGMVVIVDFRKGPGDNFILTKYGVKSDTYSITFLNSDGDPIQDDSVDLDSKKEDFQLLKQLYKAANNQYYKVDETLDELFQFINDEDIIGDSDESETK